MTIEKFTDLAGKVRVVWQTASGSVFMFKFDHDPSDETLTVLGEETEIEMENASIPEIEAHVGRHSDEILAFVKALRSGPVSAAQYSAMLGRYDWQVAAAIRNFIAEALVAANVALPATELGAVNALRSWLITKQERHLEVAISRKKWHR